MPIAIKPRRRGTRIPDQDRLHQIYDAATRGKQTGKAQSWSLDPLFDATGDPLVEQDRDLAAKVYGLANAPRPTVSLRRIRAKMFGESLDSLTDIAIFFMEHRRWSILRASAEAVTLAAKRGAWLGPKSPVSYSQAVDLVRKSVSAFRKSGALRYAPQGSTGRMLFVIPATDLKIPLPLRPREFLSAKGDYVSDDAYWRRLLRDGDVLLTSAPQEKKPQPSRLP
jgi:hypothetical protein